jgi:hypothetical protein
VPEKAVQGGDADTPRNEQHGSLGGDPGRAQAVGALDLTDKNRGGHATITKSEWSGLAVDCQGGTKYWDEEEI